MTTTGSSLAGRPVAPRADPPDPADPPDAATPAVAGRPAPLAIQVSGLTKRYGRRTVVDGLDLRIPDGAVAGFVGPNGAGKTTTLRILLGLVRPSDGHGTVLGEPLDTPARYLNRVGALIESPAFYPSLSGERNLATLAILGGHDPDRVGQVLARVGLAERGGDAFRTYSLGMKQRLGIAAALLGDPDLLILDEPTNGLDPRGIRQMRDLLRSLGGDDGPTVLVSSHLLAEMEQICDWLVAVEHGRLAYCGPADNLMAADTTAVLLRPEKPEQLETLARLVYETVAGRGTAPAASAYRDGDRIRLALAGAGESDATAVVADLNRAAARLGVTLVEITPVRTSLEERYSGLVESGAQPAQGPLLTEGTR